MLRQKPRRPLWRFEQVAGRPLTFQGREVTPIARVLRVEWLGARISWQRPLAVEVREGGTTQRIAIPDMTRRVLVGAILAAGIFAVLMVVWGRTRAT